nr:MAG TPA: hypothetical protein [Caudoviricetes sp.]
MCIFVSENMFKKSCKRMNDSKLFKDMTSKEQEKFFLDFTNYTAEKLPLLCQMSDAWTDARVKCFEEGLVYLQAFSYCREFVQKTLYWRDFSRRVNRLLFLMDKVRKEISAGRSMKTAEAAKTESQPDAQAETQAPSASPAPQPTMTPLQQIASQVAGVERLSLKELSWLLTPELQEEVKKVQLLRATATAESEQAKALAENNVSAEIIKPHSEATVKAMEMIQSIYNKVDLELAEVYYRLSEDNDFGGFKAAWEKKGGAFFGLLEILLPYYDKMGGKEFGTTLKTNDQVKAEKEAQSKAAAERAQKIHTARTYILRDDQALTSDRLKRMKEYLEECRKLEYDKIVELEKAVEIAEKKIEEEIANRPDLFAALKTTDATAATTESTQKTASKTAKKK